MTLISDPRERRDRATAKRQAILAYLADEVWSTAPILADVAGGVAVPAVHRALTSMEAAGLVARSPAPAADGPGRMVLWGITQHGLAMQPDANPLGRHFEPSKVALSAVPHQIALQRARLAAEAAGWGDWQRGERLGKDVKIRPDALVTRPDGRRVAVEIERTIKSPQRYGQIIAGHLAAIAAKQWGGVYYICPAGVDSALARMFTALQTLPGGLQWTDQQRARFRIMPAADWPPRLDLKGDQTDGR